VVYVPLHPSAKLSDAEKQAADRGSGEVAGASKISIDIDTVYHIVCGTYDVMHGVGFMIPEPFENLKLELRRGCLVVAVLAALRDEQCGYTLRKSWRRTSWRSTKGRFIRCCGDSKARVFWPASGVSMRSGINDFTGSPTPARTFWSAFWPNGATSTHR